MHYLENKGSKSRSKSDMNIMKQLFFFFKWSTFDNFPILFIKYHFFHVISNHNLMKYQQVYVLLILGQEKRNTYKNLMLTTWVKKRKDKQAQKSSIRIICFDFLA